MLKLYFGKLKREWLNGLKLIYNEIYQVKENGRMVLQIFLEQMKGRNAQIQKAQ